MRPQNAWLYEKHYEIVSLTVNLMLAIPQAHAFEPGNKRTGFVAGFAFMKTNGYERLPSADSTDLAFLHVEAILNQGNPGDLSNICGTGPLKFEASDY